MTLQQFNKLDREEAKAALLTCCGAGRWASSLLSQFPFNNEVQLIAKATDVWYYECVEADWLEAFMHHPKIGDVKDLEKKFATTKHLATNEQSSVASAPSSTVELLAQRNKEYEEKFGFIFIVFASGKLAEEMLRLLEDRLLNERPEELNIAMGEQHKITLLRLKKLMPDADWRFLKPSQITTHVLDTSVGRPGKDFTIKLQVKTTVSKWQTVTQGVTNKDGRIGDLLPPGKVCNAGIYKMIFNTARYFSDNNIKGFYPEVEIQFNVFDDQHYHVPLLINPFGYSTYRGS
jgi:5-hydroxyisourate hydrolase/2-oxo-4-hydroxy-4-carboxy-5-ureidoimidazoline decarboxylase